MRLPHIPHLLLHLHLDLLHLELLPDLLPDLRLLLDRPIIFFRRYRQFF